MRKHARWMSQPDERILEFLDEEGNFPPSAIQERILSIGRDLEYHPEYIGRRCRELAEYGLLVNVGGGTYSITELGEEFLRGEVDAAELPHLE